MSKFDDAIKKIEAIYLDHNEHTDIDNDLYHMVLPIAGY